MPFPGPAVLPGMPLEFPSQNYVELMNLRYDFTITLSVQMPENLYRQDIPKMSLQPIVENAITHGIEELDADAVIEIKGIEHEKSFEIEITDSGTGMSEKQLAILNGDASADTSSDSSSVSEDSENSDNSNSYDNSQDNGNSDNSDNTEDNE